jgi:hypothetical protein
MGLPKPEIMIVRALIVMGRSKAAQDGQLRIMTPTPGRMFRKEPVKAHFIHPRGSSRRIKIRKQRIDQNRGEMT